MNEEQEPLQTFRQELDQPTHKCSGCDTYYYAGDVPVICDNCSGVPIPVGVKEGGNGLR